MSEPEPEQRSWIDRLMQNFSSEVRNRDDLLAILQDAQRRHLIDEEATDMIEGVLQFAELKVRDIMVSRSQMVTIDHNASLDDVLQTALKSGLSRLPVVNEDRDHVIALLFVKDLLVYLANPKQPFDLDKIAQNKLFFVPESKRLNTLLREMRVARVHLAIVVDEYGGIGGLVTIEDLLEEIVGEIDDEHDADLDATFFRAIKENAYMISAITPVERFNDRFDTNFSDEKADTMGGLMTAELGHLPHIGEQWQVGNMTFTVIEAGKRNLTRLRVDIQLP